MIDHIEHNVAKADDHVDEAAIEVRIAENNQRNAIKVRNLLYLKEENLIFLCR